ncbi:MAG: AAA family ATPase [Candidatus Thermoplasmatota archaeon]
MIPPITVHRKEVTKINAAKGWILLYGRRKVGKTFLVRTFTDHDLYVLVKRGGGALFDKGPFERTDIYDQVVELILKELTKEKTVIVDEFQRLPAEFIESLQMQYPKGKLILLGSSMHVAKDLTSKKSPLLGLLSEIRLSLLSPQDIFQTLSTGMPVDHALMLSPYLRDPWTLRYLDTNPEKTILNILDYSRSAIPALIGEVFLSEDRFLSNVYESILRSIASGKNTLKEVSDQLFSKKLIGANDPSLVRPYVKIMEEMDLLERIPLHDTKGYHYVVKSKIMDLYYYIDEKYDIENTPSSLIKEIIQERMPLHIQFFIGELMAELLDGTFRYFMTNTYDIDILIARRNRIIFAGEVKWAKQVKKTEISTFLKNTERLDCRKAIITQASFDTKEVEVITPDKLLKMTKESIP